MKTIGSFDAKTHLSKILEEVSKGERYIITKHGKPVAEIKPISQSPDFNWDSAKRKLKSMRERIGREDPISLDEIIKWKDEGRS